MYEALRDEITILRLVPSSDSIRTTLRQLLLLTSNQTSEDAHVVLGIVEARPWTDELEKDIAREAAGVAGVVCPLDEHHRLIITTRGPLADATNQFTSAPILRRVATAGSALLIGFGFGRGAAEAERLARRALAKAATHGQVAAVASFRNDIDILLDVEQGAAAREETTDVPGMGVVTARVGLSATTVRRLRDASSGAEAVTTRDIATALGIEQRTARRMMQRLELAGYAERMRHRESGAGRPLTLSTASLSEIYRSQRSQVLRDELIIAKVRVRLPDPINLRHLARETAPRSHRAARRPQGGAAFEEA